MGTPGIFIEDAIGVNTLDKTADLKGSLPTIDQVVRVAATLSSGTVTVTIDSYFGLGKGTVQGAWLLQSEVGPDVLGVSAVLGSAAGEVDITITSSNATGTDVLDLIVIVRGKIEPIDAPPSP